MTNNIHTIAIRNLHLSLMRVARFQNDLYNPMELQEVIEDLATNGGAELIEPGPLLLKALGAMGLPDPIYIQQPDPSKVPAIIWDAKGGWGVLRGQNAVEHWVVERFNAESQGWAEEEVQSLDNYFIALLTLTRVFSFQGSGVFQLIKQEVLSHKKLLVEAALGGAVINLIALASSFYSMQVYDRVMPTGGMQTLAALTVGVLLATLLELFAKIARSKLYETVIDSADTKLARAVFLRFLSIRLDQMPKGVGSIAGQLRGYEMVRGFLTSITTQLLVDMPFAIGFLFVISLIGGHLVLIPIGFFIITIAFGIFFRKQTEYHASKATSAANMKTGLLVETIEGAETIKSGHAGWRILSRWIKMSEEARQQEVKIRKVSEYSQYAVAALQQLAYVTLLAIGVLEITKGSLTMGALVAVSILSGRVLGPISTIPGQLVQWGNVKSSLKGLDEIWKLKDDHHGMHPIQLDDIQGNFQFENVQAQYALTPAITIPQLVINKGERIGVIGPIGSGKTTLLRLLSGMYKPRTGRILLDGFDLSYISKPLLTSKVGYLQQDGRLFAGTLRENLILGMLDPGDERIMGVANELGLAQSVISPNPLGLSLEISEGGMGLSGGQKQLVNLTRVFLREPKIWLLDEPTASMDPTSEARVLQALNARVTRGDTLIIVTHKPELLRLVDRLIVVAANQVVLDGPKELVMQRIQEQEALLRSSTQ